MTYNWYKLFSLSEWRSTGLVSRTLLVQLEDLGRQMFLITEGNYTSVQYDDAFLPIELEDQNPYKQGDYAVFLDDDDYVWFGFLVEE